MVFRCGVIGVAVVGVIRVVVVAVVGLVVVVVLMIVLVLVLLLVLLLTRHQKSSRRHQRPDSAWSSRRISPRRPSRRPRRSTSQSVPRWRDGFLCTFAPIHGLTPRSVGAGTVEFIMDATTGEYFFMEM